MTKTCVTVQSVRKLWGSQLRVFNHTLMRSSMELFLMVELVLAWKESSCCSASWTTSAKPLCFHVTPSGSHHETLKGSPNIVNIVCSFLCSLMINYRLRSRVNDLLNTALVSQAHSFLGSRETCEDTKTMYATARFVECNDKRIGRITDRIATPGSSSGSYSYMKWRFLYMEWLLRLFHAGLMYISAARQSTGPHLPCSLDFTTLLLSWLTAGCLTLCRFVSHPREHLC